MADNGPNQVGAPGGPPTVESTVHEVPTDPPLVVESRFGDMENSKTTRDIDREGKANLGKMLDSLLSGEVDAPDEVADDATDEPAEKPKPKQRNPRPNVAKPQPALETKEEPAEEKTAEEKQKAERHALDRIRSRRQAQEEAKAAEQAKLQAEKEVERLRQEAAEARQLQQRVAKLFGEKKIDEGLKALGVPGIEGYRDLTEQYLNLQASRPKNDPEVAALKSELQELRDTIVQEQESRMRAAQEQQAQLEMQQQFAEIRNDLLNSPNERVRTLTEHVPGFAEKVFSVIQDPRSTGMQMEAIEEYVLNSFTQLHERLLTAHGLTMEQFEALLKTKGSAPSREAGKPATNPSRSGKTEASKAASRRNPPTAISTTAVEAMGGERKFDPRNRDRKWQDMLRRIQTS